MTRERCPICRKAKANIEQNSGVSGYEFIDCEKCGKCYLQKFLPQFLNMNDRTYFYKVSNWIREQNDLYEETPQISTKKFDEILSIGGKKVQEKFDLLMLFLSKNQDVSIDNEVFVQCGIEDNDELKVLLNKALDEKLIKGNTGINVGNGIFIDRIHYKGLTFDGLQYIENLDEPNKASKNIFVAFNFEEGLNEIFSTYVKQGIEELGFNYVVVNQNTTEHNKAISDEIIAKLKSSRIIIADFTNHRNSVYFEAGFAMGMKIPIIWTCQEGHTEELSFDTRQYPHLVWKDGEDLKEQIMNRIKVIL